MTMKLPQILKISLCMGIVGCGSAEQFQSMSSLNSIIDEMHLQLVTPNENSRKHAIGATGNIMVLLSDPEDSNAKFVIPVCSGIRLTSEYILSAGHCANDESTLVFDQNQIASPESNAKLEVHQFGDQIRLHYDGEKIAQAQDATNRHPMKTVYVSDKYDLAVFKAPTEPSFPALLKSQTASHVFSERIGSNQNLRVIGHPHGLPKTIADQCSQKSQDEDGYIFHDCDTLSGASGGIIIGQEGAYALHLQGTTPNSGNFYNENGRFETADELAKRVDCDGECPKEVGLNIGLSFATIAKDLKENAPELFAEIVRKSETGESYENF